MRSNKYLLCKVYVYSFFSLRQYITNFLFTVIYRPLPDKTITALDGTTTTGYGVEKVIERSNRTKIVWHSFYLPDGKLLERVQQNDIKNKNPDNSCQQCNPDSTTEPALPFHAIVATIPECSLAGISENKSSKNEVVVDKLINMDNDVQMQSEFHKLKKHHLADHQTWLKEHPLAMNILSDLTQHLLIHKPDEPIKEMKSYFEE